MNYSHPGNTLSAEYGKDSCESETDSLADVLNHIRDLCDQFYEQGIESMGYFTDHYDDIEWQKKHFQELINLLDALRQQRQSTNPLVKTVANIYTASAYYMLYNDGYVIDKEDFPEFFFFLTSEQSKQYEQEYDECLRAGHIDWQGVTAEEQKAFDDKKDTEDSWFEGAPDITSSIKHLRSIIPENSANYTSLRVKRISSDAAAVCYMDGRRNRNPNIFKISAGSDGLEPIQETGVSSSKGEIRDIIMSMPGVVREFGKMIGVDFTKLTLQEQTYFFDYAGRTDLPHFDYLVSIVNKLQETADKQHLLESFLALEHGEEFGDALLNLAEKLEANHFKELLDKIDSLRILSKDFSTNFSGYDPAFAQQVDSAAIRRVTEVLAVAEVIALGDKAETTLYNGDRVGVDSVNEILEALDMLIKGFTGIKEAMSKESSDYEINKVGANAASIRLSEGTIMGLRRKGVKYEARDAGREYDGEPRINFVVNIEDDSRVSDCISDVVRNRALSIRLDRECIIRDAQGNFVLSDPTAQNGDVSLDMGSIYGEPDNPNVIIGRILAIGNSLISQKRGLPPNYNHSREVFDPRYGTSTSFSSLVEYMANRLGIDFNKKPIHIGGSTLRAMRAKPVRA